MKFDDFFLVLLVGVIVGYLTAFRVFGYGVKHTVWMRGFVMQFLLSHIGPMEVKEIRKILEKYPVTLVEEEKENKDVQ